VFIEYTIYPVRGGGRPTVGYTAYESEMHPRIQVGGNPSMDIADFARMIAGTPQHLDFIFECKRLQLPLQQYF
jgi:hypothetical protein